MKIQIYILNLARSAHRRTHMQNQLKACDVPYVFIEAVDGKSKQAVDFNAYNPRTLDITGKALKATEVGAFISHVRAMKHAKKDGVDWAIVLEDDVVISDSFIEVVNCLPDCNNFDLVRLYTRNQTLCSGHGDVVISPRNGYSNWGGALGYAINQGGIDKVLNTYAPIHLKIDNFLFGHWIHRLNVAYTDSNMVGIENTIESDIGYQNNDKVAKKILRRLMHDIKYKLSAFYKSL